MGNENSSKGIFENYRHRNGSIKIPPQNYERRKYVIDSKFEYKTETIDLPLRNKIE